jgi:hypothetical protein
MTSSEQTTDHRPQTTDPGSKTAVGNHTSSAVERPLCVAVVGPCASGKSTLVAALKAAGYDARHPAQEHSFVKDMWLRRVNPDVLVYLDVSHEAYRQRRPKDDAGPEYLEMQRARLAHARAHADLVVDTSGTEAIEVQDKVLVFLAKLSTHP